MTEPKIWKPALAVAAGLMAWSAFVVAQDSPAAWLDRMAVAVASTNYQGTVIRRKRGQSEALKVVYRVVDGVVHERVTAQEGNGLEIIRIGDEVHCILPEQKTVLVEGFTSQSTLFSPLPRAEILNTPQYDVSMLREGRIAGRPAVLLALRPHDEYRYAHRIWLDKASGFPLQTEVASVDGEIIEELKFAEFEIADDFAADATEPTVDLKGYTWYRAPARYATETVQTEDWECDDLPAGFRPLSARTERASGDGSETTHIVYTDGIANVSVFIAEPAGEEDAGWAILGVSNSYTTVEDGYQITAVGEVPGITVQRIATSMRRR